jgi:hypothetical protein
MNLRSTPPAGAAPNPVSPLQQRKRLTQKGP